MRLLIIGGTQFLGRYIVESALAMGHDITIFHRGKTNPDLFPNVRHLYGDRGKDLHLIEKNNWDAIIDTCGYLPGIVKKSAEYLKNLVKQYVFISTISVYNDFSKPGINENSELGQTDDPLAEKVTNENYGPLKVLCERAVFEAFGANSLIIRPGLIIGPFDPTDRFTYWPVRIKKGSEVIAPSPLYSPIQFVDARDLAQFLLSMLARSKSGVYNVTGPEYNLNIKEFLQTCNTLAGNKSIFTWVSEKFIAENDLDMPVWVPSNWVGINQVDCSKALRDGLQLRPLSATISDTLKWHAVRPADYIMRAGIKPEIEVKMLEKWHHENEKIT